MASTEAARQTAEQPSTAASLAAGTLFLDDAFGVVTDILQGQTSPEGALDDA